MTQSNKNTRSLRQYILEVVSPFKASIGVLSIITSYNALFWTLNPYLLKLIIDGLASSQSEQANIWPYISTPIYLFLITWFISMIAFRTKEWIERRIYPAIRKNIISSMFSYSIRHSHKYFQNDFAGSIANRIIDMQGSMVALLNHLDDFLFNIILFSVGLGFLFYVHPYILAIMVIWCLSFLAIGIFYAPKILNKSYTFSQSKTELVGHIVDAIGNVSTIRLFARNKLENQFLSGKVKETITLDRDVRWIILKMRVLWEITIFMAIAAFLFTLVDLYSQGLVTIGDFAFVTNAYMSMIFNLWHLMDNYVQYSEEVGKCQQALVILQPLGMTNSRDAYDIKHLDGNIHFNQVHFNYDSQTKIFEDKDLTIPAKQKVGLVGFSGSGKTSFINLIIRIFDIQSGSILLDDHNIKNITMESLRNLISVIPQDPGLFNRSLMDNIRYGKPDATEQEIITASKLAHCHEFISNLPQGYQTLVGERGVKISGGQRQRIAIARAFLKQAPIIILDEATSALDSVTESYIQDSLDKLIEGKTTMVIAHRLSTLSKMDRILVFDKGKIIEDGTHQSLLEKQQSYARMWAMQSGGFIPDSLDETPEERI